MTTPSILVVDDDMAVCRILHRMLTDEQYQVQISQSVADAVGAIDQKLFDAYVLDYKLADGTGLDVAERVRSKGSEAPVILISGYDPSAVALRAEKLHISDIIEKPFSRATICNAVKKALGFSPAGEKSDAAPVSPSAEEPPEPEATKKGFPTGAVIGAIVFLLILACVAYYLLTQPH
jgi:DNA-binding NtrC family response regulator